MAPKTSQKKKTTARKSPARKPAAPEDRTPIAQVAAAEQKSNPAELLSAGTGQPFRLWQRDADGNVSAVRFVADNNGAVRIEKLAPGNGGE